MSDNKESYLEALRRYPDQKPYSPNFHGAFLAGAEWQRGAVSEPDNHHNALACPYCNPNRSLIERAEVIRRARQQADNIREQHKAERSIVIRQRTEQSMHDRARALEDFARDLEALGLQTEKKCPTCGGRLVLDNTSRVVYCERNPNNPEHYAVSLRL